MAKPRLPIRRLAADVGRPRRELRENYKFPLRIFRAPSPNRAARAPFGVTRTAALPLEGRLRAQATRQAHAAKAAGARHAETLRAQRMLPTEDLAAAPLLSSTSLRVFLKTEAILLATCCAFSVPNTCLTRAMYWALVSQAFFCL